MAQLKDLIVQGESTFLNDVNVQSALSAKSIVQRDSNLNVVTVLAPPKGIYFSPNAGSGNSVSLIITPPEVAFNNLNFTLEEWGSSGEYSMYKILINAEPKSNNAAGYDFHYSITGFRNTDLEALKRISIYSDTATANYGTIVLNPSGLDGIVKGRKQIIIKDIYCNISDNQNYKTFINTPWEITCASASTLNNLIALDCFNKYYQVSITQPSS